jgi:hypothetical protein
MQGSANDEQQAYNTAAILRLLFTAVPLAFLSPGR